MRIFLKTEVFSSVLALHPDVNGVFGELKRRFSKTLFKVEVFENAVFAFTCGRVKTEVFENDDLIGACDRLNDLILLDNVHARHRALSYFLRFCVYEWTGENDSNTLRVDVNFFKNGEKKLRFQKYPHMCGQGLK